MHVYSRKHDKERGRNPGRSAAKGPAPSAQALMQRPKGATAAMPVEANGRNPLPKVGCLPAPGPPTSKGSVRRLEPDASYLRVLLSVQPLTAPCLAWKPYQPDTPYYISAGSGCETGSTRIIQDSAPAVLGPKRGLSGAPLPVEPRGTRSVRSRLKFACPARVEYQLPASVMCTAPAFGEMSDR